MPEHPSRFARNVTYDGHTYAVAPELIFVETAFERAKRTYRSCVQTWGHTAWITVCGAVAAAIAAGVTASSNDGSPMAIAALAAGLVGLAVGFGLTFVWIWARGPRNQREELRDLLFELRQEHRDLIAEFSRPAQLVASVGMADEPGVSRPLLRLDLRNDGSQPVPVGERLGVIYPASWTTFEGCTSEGTDVFGSSFVSDEDLPGGVPARLWAMELPKPLVGGGRTTASYWRVEGPPGKHELIVRIEKLNDLLTVQLPNREATGRSR